MVNIAKGQLLNQVFCLKTIDNKIKKINKIKLKKNNLKKLKNI